MPKEAKQIEAKVCWMDAKNLVAGTKYLIQHGANRVVAKIADVQKVIKTDFSGEDAAVNKLTINDIGVVHIKLAKPCFMMLMQTTKQTVHLY